MRENVVKVDEGNMKSIIRMLALRKGIVYTYRLTRVPYDVFTINLVMTVTFVHHIFC